METYFFHILYVFIRVVSFINVSNENIIKDKSESVFLFLISFSFSLSLYLLYIGVIFKIFQKYLKFSVRKNQKSVSLWIEGYLGGVIDSITEANNLFYHGYWKGSVKVNKVFWDRNTYNSLKQYENFNHVGKLRNLSQLFNDVFWDFVWRAYLYAFEIRWRMQKTNCVL